MPQQTITRRSAPKTRTHIGSEKRSQANGRTPHRRNETEAPAIIADSIYSLKPALKSGVEVALSISKREGFILTEMYHDLVKCVHIGMLQYTGEKTSYDPLKSGLDFKIALPSILNFFCTNLLPAGWEYNIDHSEEQGYYFTVYKECSFACFWHTFEVKPVVDNLKKKDDDLLELYCLFMKNFHDYTSMDMWYSHGLGYSEEYILEEMMENCDYESEEEEIAYRKKIKDCIEDYKSGDANFWNKKINNQPVISIENLRDKLYAFKVKNKKKCLIAWMIDTCDFLALNAGVNHFVYPEEEDLERGLMFDQQMHIVWDLEDPYTAEQGEFIDSEAEGVGIMPPIANVRFTKEKSKRANLREFKNLDEIKKLEVWPKMLTSVYESYFKTLGSL